MFEEILLCRLQSRYVRMLGKKEFIVSEIFENPINNRLVDHLEEMGFFRFSILFQIVSFLQFSSTSAVTLDILKAFKNWFSS